ncbi:MAG: hypothetical protein IT460_13885 [Planctomycetes bacterium]|nr:hypothetical protein [Planctomycetota bacterium]
MREIRSVVSLVGVAALTGCVPFAPPILGPLLLPPLLLDSAIRSAQGGESLVDVSDLVRASGRDTPTLARHAALAVPSLRGRVADQGATALRVRPRCTDEERAALESWVAAETARARR